MRLRLFSLMGVLAGLSACLVACQNAPPAAQPTVAAPASAKSTANTADMADIAVSGRISLSTEPLPGQAAQSFISAFRLKGHVEQGQIDLQAPTGSLLAVLRWQAGSAQIEPAGKPSLHYANLQAMLKEVLGSGSPEPALLFAWLQGQSGQHPDWRVDLSQFTSRKLIVAERLQPLPRTQVRIKLDETP